MSTSYGEEFAIQLVAQTLMHDAEFGVTGSLSLIDERNAKEMYVASYLSEESYYIIELSSAWERGNVDHSIGYALGTETTIVRTCETAEEAAKALVALALQHRLMPSYVVLFEDIL